ncbi:MAG: NAD(P)-dependent alcohol dehydrogenase [Methylobacteriaceae bacterium]|nr:NAD(P)-dependent alcohol dehydrogenase [Methylobacteriaceae bacterium]
MTDTSIRAVALEGGFGVDRLTLTRRERIAPGPRQARVRLHAASLNRRDLLLVEGVYNPRQALPIVPGSDGAGVVEAVGSGCRRVKVGDRVVVHFFPGWIAGEPTAEKLATGLGGPGGDGVLREAMTIDEDALVAIPAEMSFETAATLPCAALTAWSAIVELGRVRPGDTVVTQGTGGVSIFALQVAKMCGARVIATTSSPAKAERLHALGADHVIDYRAEPDWGRAARNLADGRIDLIVEVGGAGTLESSLRAIRPGGCIALIGVLSGAKAAVTLTLAVMRQVRLQGVTCGDREQLEAMLRAVAANGIDPAISHTFALEEARAAFETMRAERHVGKIVVTI